ncbi:MAG: hypothetical protein ACMXYD_04455 [Candidatus Woesearchaeota archaeon]
MIILVDVGGVLINYEHQRSINAAKQQGLTGEINEALFGRGYKDFSTGASQQHYLAYANTCLDQEIPLNKLKELHDAMFTTTNNELVTWLKQFPKENVVLVTNTNEWQTAAERERLPALATREYRSHQQQATKIDFFTRMLAELPQTTYVFIDDEEKNIQKAKELGILTHQYTDMNSLQTFFKTQIQ